VKERHCHPDEARDREKQSLFKIKVSADLSDKKYFCYGIFEPRI